MSWLRGLMADGHGERGSASLEAAIIVPAFGLFVALIVLGGRTALAHQVVQSAASDAARSASLERTVSAARNAATDAAALAFVQQAGGDDVLPGADASGSMTATSITLVVTGHSLSVVPGWTPQVRQHVTAARERLSP